MTWHNKVMWTEGMFLQPQHFQQHDRYLTRLVDARIGAGRPIPLVDLQTVDAYLQPLPRDGQAVRPKVSSGSFEFAQDPGFRVGDAVKKSGNSVSRS